jgi:hypothetical protein
MDIHFDLVRKGDIHELYVAKAIQNNNCIELGYVIFYQNIYVFIDTKGDVNKLSPNTDAVEAALKRELLTYIKNDIQVNFPFSKG